MAAFVDATAAKAGLGSSAALPDMKTTDPFVALSASHALIVNRCGSMKLEFHACSPLFVSHFKQVDLRYRSRDIQERCRYGQTSPLLFLRRQPADSGLLKSRSQMMAS